MTQTALARTVGISRQRLGDLENGRGAGAPPEVWFALAEALGRYLKFEFARDPQAELADADGAPFEVGMCWIVRDTQANRALVARYEHIFEARFPGSSSQWVRALTTPGAPMPSRPGLVRCDRATRLFARRRNP